MASPLFISESFFSFIVVIYLLSILPSPSSDNVFGYIDRGRVENGGMVGPRIYHTGNVRYGAGSLQYRQEINDLQDARSALIRIKAEGGHGSFS
jgi:hypothetical protein